MPQLPERDSTLSGAKETLVIATTIAAAVGFTATAWYLAELYAFATIFRRRDDVLWDQLGRPERFGISGQTKFLMIALGFKSLPTDVAYRYRGRFVRIRTLLVVILAAFFYLSVRAS